MRKQTFLIALTCMIVVLAFVFISANATAGPRLNTFEHNTVFPQGCRCCSFIGQVPNLRCGKVCCADDCC
ncbi:hypothetical protein M5689_009927 [Euphorbia peplus]|nr:hypothetical protein M5689_009927 [Euphorbia peplus]